MFQDRRERLSEIFLWMLLGIHRIEVVRIGPTERVEPERRPFRIFLFKIAEALTDIFVLREVEVIQNYVTELMPNESGELA